MYIVSMMNKKKTGKLKAKKPMRIELNTKGYTVKLGR